MSHIFPCTTPTFSINQCFIRGLSRAVPPIERKVSITGYTATERGESQLSRWRVLAVGKLGVWVFQIPHVPAYPAHPCE